MGEKHPLATEGSWVELRDPRELCAGDKRRVMRMIHDPEQVVSAGLDVVDGLIAMMVVNWQLPVQLPLPSQSLESLDLLKIPDYDRLCELVEPARQVLFPESPDPATVKDPNSPTPPSAA